MSDHNPFSVDPNSALSRKIDELAEIFLKPENIPDPNDPILFIPARKKDPGFELLTANHPEEPYPILLLFTSPALIGRYLERQQIKGMDGILNLTLRRCRESAENFMVMGINKICIDRCPCGENMVIHGIEAFRDEHTTWQLIALNHATKEVLYWHHLSVSLKLFKYDNFPAAISEAIQAIQHLIYFRPEAHRLIAYYAILKNDEALFNAAYNSLKNIDPKCLPAMIIRKREREDNGSKELIDLMSRDDFLKNL